MRARASFELCVASSARALASQQLELRASKQKVLSWVRSPEVPRLAFFSVKLPQLGKTRNFFCEITAIGRSWRPSPNLRRGLSLKIVPIWGQKSKEDVKGGREEPHGGNNSKILRIFAAILSPFMAVFTAICPIFWILICLLRLIRLCPIPVDLVEVSSLKIQPIILQFEVLRQELEDGDHYPLLLVLLQLIYKGKKKL